MPNLIFLFMKKLNTKLKLSKTTVAALDQEQLATVKGGFTYSLSLGSICRLSQGFDEKRSICQEGTPYVV